MQIPTAPDPSVSWTARLRARVKRTLAPPTIVLLYHRVLPQPGRDINLLVTRTEHFAAQMAWLGEYCRPLTLDEFLDNFERPSRMKVALDGGKPRVLVTFDDGYADNLHFALPILAEHSIPATLFATSAMIGSTEPFWWDAAEQLAFTPQIANTWELPDGSRIARTSDPARDYWKFMNALRPLSDLRRRAILLQLASQAGIRPQCAEWTRPLTWEELQAWQAAGMSVGGHTRTHAHLVAQMTETIVTEVSECKRDLEARLEGRVHSFAYPYGSRTDFDLRAEAATQVAGYRCAFANIPGNARWARTAYSIPRCLVRDWPLEAFVTHFAAWCRS